jgi:hypothetical protein
LRLLIDMDVIFVKREYQKEVSCLDAMNVTTTCVPPAKQILAKQRQRLNSTTCNNNNNN